jgi:lysophospholipase L1-like esterase
VFFGIGINDAHDPNFSEKNYAANYEKIMAQIKAVNPKVFFVFITNNDSYGTNKKLNTNAPLVQKVMFDLAQKHEGAVWDLFSIMGGLKSSTMWRDANLMAKDRIHFSGEGYNLLGDLLFNAFMEAFEEYIKTQAK